jgi:hypothetical protein
MATHMVKTTYALDVETVRALENLAQRWNVSKSEALRRAIRASSVQAPTEALTPVQALDRVQQSLGLSAPEAARWAAAVRAGRREGSRRREARRR